MAEKKNWRSQERNTVSHSDKLLVKLKITMKKLLTLNILALLLSFSFSASAQSHTEAKKLLTEASQKLKSHKNVVIDFTYKLENTRVEPPITQTESGTIAVKGDDYRLKIMGTEQIRSGQKVYLILMDDEEVQVNDFDEENPGLTPTAILNSYNKGYSYKLGGEATVGGKKVQYIILKPNASEEEDKVMVGIEKESKQLVSLQRFGTNGTITTFKINSFKPDQSLPANYFTFNKKDYPGFYIAD